MNFDKIKELLEDLRLEEALEIINNSIGELNSPSELSLAYLLRGEIYYELEKLDEALRDINKALEIASDNVIARAYIAKANVYNALGDLEKAIIYYDKAIEASKNNPIELAIAYINRGNAFLYSGELSKAISDYNNAIETLEKIAKDYRSRYSLALAYLNRGVAYALEGSLYEALRDYNKAIEILAKLPKRPRYLLDLAAAYINRGNAYRSLGYLKEALEGYIKAIGILKAIRNKKAYRLLILAYYNVIFTLGLSASSAKYLAEIRLLLAIRLKNFEPKTAHDARLLLAIFNVFYNYLALGKALEIILRLNFSLKRLDIAKDFRKASRKLLAIYSMTRINRAF